MKLEFYSKFVLFPVLVGGTPGGTLGYSWLCAQGFTAGGARGTGAVDRTGAGCVHSTHRIAFTLSLAPPSSFMK